MACPFFELPAELHLEITKLLPKEDAVRLSSTCASYRNFLAPDIFRTITLDNYRNKRLPAQALANSLYGEHVRRLHFIGHAPVSRRLGIAYVDTEGVFPDSVRTSLSDLELFPNLETLTVEFRFSLSSADSWMTDFRLFDEEEREEQILLAEKSQAWRALIAKTFEALAQNKKLKALEIVNLPPKEVSTYQSPAFHAFLATLNRFSLSLWGGKDSQGLCTNLLKPYLTFLSKLDQFFFNHLHSVTSFVLKASEAGPLGLQGGHHAPLALDQTQMPALRTLHLEHVFLCAELLDFLGGHAHVLESLTLHRCFAATELWDMHIDENSPTVNAELAQYRVDWREFFMFLVESRPRRLRRVDITPVEELPYCDGKETDDEMLHEIEALRETMGHDREGRRRLFAHAALEYESGRLDQDEEVNRWAFLRGEDLWAWERLKELVEENVREGNVRTRLQGMSISREFC